ncbi:MAG: DUF3301 domain-containing protein [Oleiphilaceae bacterium]|nr:DUF3301 domain-containing protein [Oleiphilaceae bacterium]
MSLRSIALTALVIVVVWLWQANRKLKDRALRRAMQYCKELDVKLLDQTIVLKRLRPQRDSRGRWHLMRQYEFDFSAGGTARYKGEVLMQGRQITRIQLQPHRVD